MAAFDFPSSPSVNQTYTANGVTWKWNGTMWMRVSGAGYLEKIEEGNSKVEVDDSGSGFITATTDGTERLRITSDGKTGVGVASPLNRFHVYGANTIARFQSSSSYVDVLFQNTGATNGFIQYNNSGDFRFYANSGSTPTLDITAGSPGNVICKGNLGIGDDSPTKPLTVGTTTPVILLDDQSSRTLEIRGPSTTHNATVLTTSTHDLLLGTDNTERLRIDSSGRLLLGLNSSIGGNAIFQVQGSGNKKAQFHQPDSGNCHIQFTNTQTGTSSNNGVEVGLGGDEQAQIWNYHNSYFRIGTNGSEKLRITAAGNVGINATSPERKLEVVDTNSNGSYPLAVSNFIDATANRGAAIDFRLTTGGNSRGEIGCKWTSNSSSDGTAFYFAPNDGTTGNIERLRITSEGFVGIGEQSPDQTLVIRKDSASTSAGQYPVIDLRNDNASGYNHIRFMRGGTEVASIVSSNADNDLRFRTNSANERLRITSDGDLKSGNINISAYANTHNIDNYSVFLSDNHANTFFGQNLRLDYSGTSGNHQLKVINQHGQIGGAGMLIGGNQSSNVNELNFYTVAANQPAGTRVDDTNKRLTIRSNGDITIRGTNSQYVEAAAFEQTNASKNAIVANNGGFVSFNSLRNTNSTIISHDPNSNSGRRITFPVAGAVHFSMYQDIIVSGTSGYTQCRLYKNGTADRYALITYTNGQWDSIVMNTVVEVAANDYLEFYYTGGTITSMDYQTWCSYNFVFYPINTNRG